MGLDWCCVVCSMDNHFSCLNINGHLTPINYCVSDILWLDAYDLREHPFRIGFLHNPVELNVNIKGDQNKNPVFETGKTLRSKMTEKDGRKHHAKRRSLIVDILFLKTVF